MADWIKDRTPTKDDADESGFVITQNGWSVHWEDVQPETGWCHPEDGLTLIAQKASQKESPKPEQRAPLIPTARQWRKHRIMVLADAVRTAVERDWADIARNYVAELDALLTELDAIHD